MYGEQDRARGRSMAIRFGDDALATRLHPVARAHPETGRVALFVSPGYTIGIEGLPADESADLLKRLFEHQKRPEFVYRHRWAPGDFLIWDNCATQHRAVIDYELPLRRRMERTTLRGSVPF
jgi:taurine dioxygenase